MCPISNLEAGSFPQHDERDLKNFYFKFTVDGGYSMWSPWLLCDADCGGGIQERSRFCNNPVPQPGGKDCSILGSNKETQFCNVFPCSGNF